MTSRSNIYYWKCDSPQSLVQKQQLYFQGKYKDEMAIVVARACRDFYNREPDAVRPAGCDGNHFAYLVDYPGYRYFFRADDGACDDDYMLAESRLMQLVSTAGLPVPAVYLTETDISRYGFRFQIMDCVPEQCLNVYYKNEQLNIPAVTQQLGELLRQLHSIKLTGFGFIDTDHLKNNDIIQGLDQSCCAYFDKRLDDHIAYLYDHRLLTRKEVDEIIHLFDLHRSLLERKEGVLVHRDLALWNVLGTPHEVTALIDWDDAISGDPADDLGMLRCFYDDDFMTMLIQGYGAGKALSDDFIRRTWLYCLRNMLWKTMIRDYMGYFQKADSFFLNNNKHHVSLREYTFNKIKKAMNMLRN